ncbi:hypothetical protein LWI29_019024 [Acer saccharum]|uniref:Protein DETOXIFICATION n=1 Tax=Acer saccharum TaxID=4024 RepID=A0AA39VJ31_ACESA|nr:hypothetical protein LWI29_019024 [Acer saccharum]
MHLVQHSPHAECCTPTNQNLTPHPIIQLSHPTHPPTQQTTHLNRSRGRRRQEATAATRSEGCSDDGDAKSRRGAGGCGGGESGGGRRKPSRSRRRRRCSSLIAVAVSSPSSLHPPDRVAAVASCRRRPLLLLSPTKNKYGEINVELKKQMGLAGPLVAVSFLQCSLLMISVMFVGHLGELSLASASMATSFAGVTGFSFMVTFSSS